MFYYIRKNYISNLIEFVLQLFYAGFMTAASVILTYAINAIVIQDNILFFRWLILSLICWFISFAFNYAEAIFKSKLIQKMCTQIRSDLLNKISDLDYKSFKEKNNGEFVSWLSSDIKDIEESGFKNFYNFTNGLFIAVFAGAALFTFHYTLLVLTLFLAFIISFGPNLLVRFAKESMHEYSVANENLISKATQWLSGFSVLLSNNKTKLLDEQIKPAYNLVADKKIEYVKINVLIQLIIMVINIFSQFSIIGLSGYLANAGLVTVGTIVSAGNLGSQLFGSLSELSSLKVAIEATEVIFNKYSKFFKEHQKIKIPEIENLSTYKELSIKGLNYKYGNQEIEFPDMNFIEGKKYAIIGESGSGKTTLLNILSGNYRDYGGTIRFGLNNLNSVPIDSWYENVSIVPQQPYLFPTSIKNNITLFENFSDTRLENTLRMSGLNHWIEELDQGVDTVVGETMGNISGGQKQRIALARAVIRGKSMIFIDEGTSSLDKKTAEYIENILFNLENITVIMVTHRLNDKKDLYDGIYSLS